jgi:hypothetical protein
MNTTYKLTFAVLLGAMFATVYMLMQEPWKAGASVEVGNAYLSTTTPAVADLTNLCKAGIGMASSTTGSLGSVNVLASGAGTLVLYDATTSDATQRSSDQATSSLRLADFPASPTVGSYHFDVEFKRGLLVDYSTTGSGVSSTTISYRCEG